jgi:hypothetical protein
LESNRSLPIYDAYPAEAGLESLHGGDSVSSNAGPAAAGVTVLGGTSVGDVASGLDGPVPADSAESTGHGNPQSPGWTKAAAGGGDARRASGRRERTVQRKRVQIGPSRESGERAAAKSGHRASPRVSGPAAATGALWKPVSLGFGHMN